MGHIRTHMGHIRTDRVTDTRVRLYVFMYAYSSHICRYIRMYICTVPGVVYTYIHVYRHIRMYMHVYSVTDTLYVYREAYTYIHVYRHTYVHECVQCQSRVHETGAKSRNRPPVWAVPSGGIAQTGGRLRLFAPVSWTLLYHHVTARGICTRAVDCDLFSWLN